MKPLISLALLLAAAPAAAVTPDSASVQATVSVRLGRVVLPDSRGSSAIGLPGPLGAQAGALVSNSSGEAIGYSNVSATWGSASQGQVAIDWGWATTGIANSDAEIDTRTDPGLGWVYNFTTGSQAGSFNANWTMDVVGGEDAFGLNGIYGSGGLPQFVTPFTATPITGIGSFSVALSPFTSYSFGLLNFGNITGSITDRTALARFNMDWSITGGGGGGSTVPEPASWAMLLAGFGLVGSTLRQRRRQAA